MNNNKQQTAVEWLVEQLARKNNEFQALTFYYDHKEEIEQAKEMDMQQKMDAWNDGNCNTDLKGNPSANYAISAEHYYNQEYGGNNEQQ